MVAAFQLNALAAVPGALSARARGVLPSSQLRPNSSTTRDRTTIQCSLINEVCPVDCIHPTEDEPSFADVSQLFIDPEECIDCDACVEVCPVDAIFADDKLPQEWEHFTKINADYYANKP